MSEPVYQGESIWHMKRCLWCLGEVKDTEAIFVGDKLYCSAECRAKDEASPEGKE